MWKPEKLTGFYLRATVALNSLNCKIIKIIGIIKNYQIVQSAFFQSIFINFQLLMQGYLAKKLFKIFWNLLTGRDRRQIYLLVLINVKRIDKLFFPLKS